MSHTIRRTPSKPMSPELTAAMAILASSFIHFCIVLWFHAAGIGFGAPAVDPYEPPRFHLQPVKIDPKHLEENQPHAMASNLPPAQREVLLDPEKIASFGGPLNAPSIPMPRIQDETPAPLSLTASTTPVNAFSALPIEAKGNIPQVAQALANEASTAALQEANNALKGSLAGGNASSASPGMGAPAPKFDEISSLVNLKPPTTLSRPAFQPILLRLSSDVLFEFDSFQLQPTSIPSLQQVAQILSSAVKSTITIEGHTDTFGDDAYNQKLSEQRAQSIASWLSQQPSLAGRKFTIKGYGKTRPIANPSGTIEEQKPNRRVEIRVEAEK